MNRLLFELNEAFIIAAQQINANRTRSLLTALGVIIGIIAVTLMGTAINGIDTGVNKSLSIIGDDILYVTKWPWREVNDWWNFRNRPPIRADFAEKINEAIAANPSSALKVAVPTDAVGSRIFRGDYSVNNIFTLGTTSDMPRISKALVKEGRFFNEAESRAGRNVVVIGFDVAEALFPGQSPIGQEIRLRGQNFTVVGVMEKQGSFLGLFSWDSNVAIPLVALRKMFMRQTEGAEIRVQVDPARFEEARWELVGLMRRIRAVPPEQNNNFEVNTQETVKAQLDPIRNGIAMAGFFITGLALFVGAIGIMNITFVSVKERTKEIGTRKALGARRRTILSQFLIEAASISGCGGVVGLIMTLTLTFIVSVLFPALPVTFSVKLVVLAMGLSVGVGVLAGFIPAWLASRLDPVEALRYE